MTEPIFELVLEPDVTQLVLEPPPSTTMVLSPDVTQITVSPVGDQGPAGADGEDGEPGPPGSGGLSEPEIVTIVETSMLNHELDPTPHVAYDDLPSFALLFENGLN